MVRLKHAGGISMYINFFQASQFHYGSIKTKEASDDYKSKAFLSQFHYGSIKTMQIAQRTQKFELQSQFHYGSIKTNYDYSRSRNGGCCLNSTMVRLKL